jgi:hypothetical protein
MAQMGPVLDVWGDEKIPGIPSTLVTFHRHLTECDEVLAKHLGPTTPLRKEIRKLLKEINDRY